MLQFNKIFISAIIAFWGLTSCGTQISYSNEIVRMDPVPVSDDEYVEPDIEEEIETPAPVDETENDTTQDAQDEIPVPDDNSDENVSAPDENVSAETFSYDDVSEPDVSYETEPEVEPEPETETVQYISGGFPIWNYAYLSGEYLGRVRIPDVGVDVACYNTNAQYVCDREDSAEFIMMGNPPEVYNWTALLGDHSYQGFDAIKNIVPGTIMFFDAWDGNTYAYVADTIDRNGCNNGVDILDHNGNTIFIGGIWCYTCNTNWHDITLVHFTAM